MKLIAEPHDPIKVLANYLAEEYLFNDFTYVSDEILQILHSTPTPFLAPTSRKSSSNSSRPGHRHKRRSLSSIPEEDLTKKRLTPLFD